MFGKAKRNAKRALSAGSVMALLALTLILAVGQPPYVSHAHERGFFCESEILGSDVASVPHIILFEDLNFHGRHTHVFKCDDNLHVENHFGDTVTSFIILSGEWRFFWDIKYENQMMLKSGSDALGPGGYENINRYFVPQRITENDPNDDLSSLCALGTEGCK